jgi:hypothetical protein
MRDNVDNHNQKNEARECALSAIPWTVLHCFFCGCLLVFSFIFPSIKMVALLVGIFLAIALVVFMIHLYIKISKLEEKNEQQ